MKKFTFFLLAMMVSLFSQAQDVKVISISETPTAEPEAGKLYVVQCNAQHDNITTWLYDAGATPKGDNTSTIAENELVDATRIWKIEPAEGEGVYSVQSYATSKYINIEGTGNGGAVTMSATKTTVIISVSGEYVALKHMTANQWIDMGYNGLGIETWSGDVGGSRRMQLFEVEIDGEVSPMQSAMKSLELTFSSLNTETKKPLYFEENMGTKPNQYTGIEELQAYRDLFNHAEEVLDAGPEGAEDAGLTPEDVLKLAADLQAAYEAMVATKVPYEIAVKEGYYVIKSAMDFHKATFVEPTACSTCGDTELTKISDNEWECAANGHITEGATVDAHFVKAVYDNGGKPGWKTFEEKADFLFKVTAIEGQKNQYTMINQLNGKSFTAPNALGTAETPMCFDWRADNVEVFTGVGNETKTVPVVVNIRLAAEASRAYRYIHAGGHGGGAGVSGDIVNWSTGAEGEAMNASDWYMDEIDEATALAWIEAASPAKKIKAVLDSVNVIKNAFPKQKTIAEDNSTNVDTTNPLITDPTQFHSPMTTDDTQTQGDIDAVYPFLLDGKTNTYWHSRWEDGNQPNGTHYLQVSDITAESVAFVMTRRPVNNDHVTSMSVWGYDSADDAITKEEGVKLAELEMPFTSNTEVITSAPFLTQGKTVIRFYAETTTNNRGYWHCSEFQMYPATGSKGATTTQAEVRAEQIAAVEAALAAWAEKGYTIENVTDPEDAEFVAASQAVFNAYAAWTAVYSDPNPMRNTVKKAEEYAKMIVVGENPGQWPAGSSATAITEAVAAANAYNNTGAYTPAETEAKIAALNDAMDNVAGQANQIVLGKWYKFRLPTEEEYEEHGWDKAGAISAAQGDLYGNYIAPALDEAPIAEGDPRTHAIVENSELFKGQLLRFTEAADGSENEAAFRFVEIGDGKVGLQHSSGWFVTTGGALSTTPALFSTRAIGYGKSLIKVQDTQGVDVNAGGTPSYLHAQVAGHRLVAWAADAIDSRSALYIENADDIEMADALRENINVAGIEGNKKTFYTSAFTLTDMTNAQLYTFEGYEKTETGVKVAFSQTYKAPAGVAVLMIVEEAIEEEKEVTLEYSLNEKEFAAEPDSTVALVGTYKYQWVAEEDMPHTITIFENVMQQASGVDNTDCARDISAGTGAINLTLAEEIDTEGKDLVIEVAGEFNPTGITEIVNNAINANGAIYTIDGKYVGKGNLGTISRMGTGIYIVNGVKVAVK